MAARGPVDPALDLSIALDAAERWRRRAKARGQKIAALRQHRYTEADTPTRLAKRVTRLCAWARAAVEARGEALPEALPPAPLKPADVTDELVERQIGLTRDLLSIEFFEQGLDAARSVGRIVTLGRASGTGFLVSPELVMTNQHVLRSRSEAEGSTLELDFEANRFGVPKTTQSFRLRPARFFLADAGLDFALCAIDPTSAQGMALAAYGFRPLIGKEGKIAIGEPVNIVQHPRGLEKQIVIRNNRLVDLPDAPAMDAFFHYEADTDRGSSGSPVFNDQWEVVALHHSGVPKTNAKGQLVDDRGRVITEQGDSGRIVWVANEGIRVSRLVAHIRTRELTDRAAEALRRSTLDLWARHGQPEVAEHAALVLPRPVAEPPARAARVDLTVPLHLSLALGDPETPARPLEAALLQRAGPDPDDPRYERRPGYDPWHLGFEAPLPVLADDRHGPVATYGDQDGGELRYHHFSVVMNARRRLAYVAAANLRAEAPFHHERQDGDRWFFDPRLPMRLQAGQEYYADSPLDRGHLVRQDDAAWGMTAHEAKLASDDTFHWTNCSPQHQIRNQADRANQRGLLLWGNLEQAVSRLARRFGSRLSVMSGPIFSDHDRPYRTDFWLPAEFWKLILVKDDAGRPRALAFRLSQAGQIADLPPDRFASEEVAPYAPFQIRIVDLQALTGLDLKAYLAWDPAAGGAKRREGAEDRMTLRKIDREDDVLI